MPPRSVFSSQLPDFVPSMSASAEVFVPLEDNSSINSPRQQELVSADAPEFVPGASVDARSALQQALSGAAQTEETSESGGTDLNGTLDVGIDVDDDIDDTLLELDEVHETPPSESEPLRMPHHAVLERFFAAVPPLRRPYVGYFPRAELLRDCERRQRELLRRHVPAEAELLKLPLTLHNDQYHSLALLEHATENAWRPRGLTTQSLKATRSADGVVVMLRRLCNWQKDDRTDSRENVLRRWRSVRDDGAFVGLLDVFETRAFGDTSLVLVYDFYAMSVTLEQAFLPVRGSTAEQRRKQRAAAPPPSASAAWRITLQLLGALASLRRCNERLAAHKSEQTPMCVRRLSPSNVKQAKEAEKEMQRSSDVDAQRRHQEAAEDARSLLRFVRWLLVSDTVSDGDSASASATDGEHGDHLTPSDHSKADDNVTAMTYLKRRIQHGLSVENACTRVATRLARHATSNLQLADATLAELARSTQNGRLFRLLCKLDFVTHRPTALSEPDPRYLPLQLFRAHLFHLARADGRQNVSLAHVVESLSRLDTRSSESVMLSSVDASRVLVITYASLAALLDAAFAAATGHVAMPQGGWIVPNSHAIPLPDANNSAAS
ncbi:MAG: hypothetical protein MHM6MM_000454 [Cercozoa sp. M6MM]